MERASIARFVVKNPPLIVAIRRSESELVSGRSDLGGLALATGHSVGDPSVDPRADERVASDDEGPPLDVIIADEMGLSTLSPTQTSTSNDAADVETSTKPAPPLDDLVQRIPVAVRDALEDLFRARFVKVARVPKSAMIDPAKTGKASIPPASPS